MNVSLPDATAYNSKQLAIQKDMTPSLYAMFFKVTYNGGGLYLWLWADTNKTKNKPMIEKALITQTQTDVTISTNLCY